METESSQALSNNVSPASDSQKSKEALAPIDMDDFDNNDDDLALPTENETIVKKMDARRKIEIYFEKKRLQEQLGDSAEIDFDF